MRKQTKRDSRAVIMACAVIWGLTNPAWGGQTLGTPVFGVAPGTAQITLTNCDIPYFQYVIQASSNLQDWISVWNTSSAVPTGSPSEPYQTLASFAESIGVDPAVIGSSVPEPTCLVIAALGTAMLATRRRRR